MRTRSPEGDLVSDGHWEDRDQVFPTPGVRKSKTKGSP